jgi:hypothetical protein
MYRAHADVWTSVHLSVTVLPNLLGWPCVLSRSRPPSHPQLVSHNSNRGWLQIGTFQPLPSFVVRDQLSTSDRASHRSGKPYSLSGGGWTRNWLKIRMMTGIPLARGELGGRSWWRSSWKSTVKLIFANMHSCTTWVIH